MSRNGNTPRPTRKRKKIKPLREDQLGKRLTSSQRIPTAIEGIPEELKWIDSWALCKLVRNPDGPKLKKLPFQLSGEIAVSTDRDHFVSFDEVTESRMLQNLDVNGFSFGLFPDCDVTVFDFDAIDTMTPDAQQKIKALAKLTYSEWSQSGKGVHLFFKGFENVILRNKFVWGGVPLEHYRDKRFIFVTGNRTQWSKSKLSEIDLQQLENILGLLPEKAKQSPQMSSAEVSADPTITTEELFRLLEENARGKDRDSRGVRGALVYLTEGYDDAMFQGVFGFKNDGVNRRSECDLITCKELIRLGAVYSQVDELMLQYRPRGDNKWKRKDYAVRTFVEAKAEVKEERNRAVVTIDDFEGVEEDPEKVYREMQRKNADRDFADRKTLESVVDEHNDMILQRGSVKVVKKLYRRAHRLAERINYREIMRLNDLYGLVKIGDNSVVGGYMFGEKSLMRWDGFRRLMMGEKNAVYLKERASTAGFRSGLMKIVPIVSVDEWLAHLDKRVFSKTPVFHPSPDLLISNKSFIRVPMDARYNLFSGCLYKPENEPGEYDLILDHLLNVWCSGNKAIYEYVVNWFARMVQLPHKQAMSSIVLKSDPGAGKNIITDIFNGYYGAHAAEIQDMDSLAKFNGRAAGAILLVLNEATFGGSKRTQGVLKNFITGDKVTIEKKYQDAIEIKNCTHICIFSNNEWIVPVDMFDRRLLILECMEVKGVQYFRELSKQIHSGGDRAFIEFLLNKDISDFDPTVIPHHGESRLHIEQTRRSLTVFDQWCLDIIEDGVVKLKSGLEIELKRYEPTKISLLDMKDAYFASEEFKRSRSHTNGCRNMAHRMTRLYGIAVRNKRAVRCYTSEKRNRGIVIPPLKAIKKVWRWDDL